MATYYISTSGSTSNIGTTPNLPWPLSKVTSTAFVAGDNILFRKGDTFGTFTFTHSGTAGNPITFDLFGTAAHNAIFDAALANTPCAQFTNTAFITINNLSFINSTSNNGNLFFTGAGSHDITIFNCHISVARRGLNMTNCGGNISIKQSYFEQFGAVITGGNPSSGAGSAIQLNNCNGPGIEVASNFCYTAVTLNNANTVNQGIGDVISIFQCYGTVGSYILVHDNQVRGGGSGSNGYAGLVLGDVGGQYQRGYNNIFVNSGKVGAQVQGGTFIDMSNNRIYGGILPYTSVGLSFGNYYTVAGVKQPCNNITMGNNLICFYSGSNGHNFNKWIDTGSGVTTPTNWASNTSDTGCDAGAFDALLTNPLWTGTPWDTATGLLSITGRKMIQL